MVMIISESFVISTSSLLMRSSLYFICFINSFARNSRFIVAATNDETNNIKYNIPISMAFSLAATVMTVISIAGARDRTINNGMYLNDTLIAVIYILVMSDLVIMVGTPWFFIFFFVSAVI